eukprot:g22286.t1
MLNSSIASSCVPQRKTIMASSEGTRDTSDRVPFVIQYFPGAEKLHHVLRTLQHIIDDNEHLTKIIPMPPLRAFKQPPNLKQTIVCRKRHSLQENSNHNTIQPCHASLCKTRQIFKMNTTITRWKTTHHVHSRYSCDSANVVDLIRCRQGCLRLVILARSQRRYINRWMDTAQQSQDRDVPSQWGNTSAVKDIRPQIF